MKIARKIERHRDDDQVDQERHHAPRQHALEQLGLSGGIVGVRLDLDVEADPLRFALRHAHDLAALTRK